MSPDPNRSVPSVLFQLYLVLIRLWRVRDQGYYLRFIYIYGEPKLEIVLGPMENQPDPVDIIHEDTKDHFQTDLTWKTKPELLDWLEEHAMKVNCEELNFLIGMSEKEAIELAEEAIVEVAVCCLQKQGWLDVWVIKDGKIIKNQSQLMTHVAEKHGVSI